MGIFEFDQLASTGTVIILSTEGAKVDVLRLGRPQITGLCFSRMDPDDMYITDSSGHSGGLLRITFKREEDGNSNDGSLKL